MFKLPINPQQVLYPANLHVIVLTEPVSWKYPHRVASVELFQQYNPRRAIAMELSLQSYLYKLVPNRGIFPSSSGVLPCL